MTLCLIIAAVLIHCLFLVFNAVIAASLRTPLPERIAVIIVASQKSAPVGITLVTCITSDSYKQGAMTVPLIIGQISQIFIGQSLANYFAARVQREALQALPVSPPVSITCEFELSAAALDREVPLVK